MESVFDVIRKRYSVRNYSSRPIKKDKIQQIEAYLKENLQGPLDLNSLGQYSKVLEAVRIAPSASNKQPWRIMKGEGNQYHFYMKEDMAYNTAFKNIRIQNLDMGIAMCHFELAAVELGLKGVWKMEKPVLAAGDLKYIVSWVG